MINQKRKQLKRKQKQKKKLKMSRIGLLVKKVLGLVMKMEIKKGHMLINR